MAELRALRPPPAPPRLNDVWRARYVEALAVDLNPRLSASGSTHPDWHVNDIIYTSTDGFEIGGWLLLPRQGTVERGLVVGHGYGDQPDLDIPVEWTAVLFPCFRGLSRSRRPPNLTCSWRLEKLRQLDIVLAIGDADPFLDDNRRLSHLLDAKGIGHRLHLWGGRAHRAGAWRKMAALYI